jgi:hypothetical protein
MHPLPFRFPLVRLLFALLFFSATGFGAGKGVIIYKDQTYLADGFAEAVEYDQLEEYPNVFNLTTAQKETISILTGKIVKNIRYLDREALSEVIEPRDLARVTSAISEESTAARRYPKASKLLDPHIRQLQEIVDRFQKGEAILDGAWLPSKEAAFKIKKEREAAIAAADADDIRQAEALRLAREKRAADERAKRLEQKVLFEKESFRKQAAAKAAEEQRKLLEESQAAEARQKEEEQRMAAEKQAVEERQIGYASRKMREVDRFTEEFDRPIFAASEPAAKLPGESREKKAEEGGSNAAQATVQKQPDAPASAKSP